VLRLVLANVATIIFPGGGDFGAVVDDLIAAGAASVERADRGVDVWE